jgi:hypothetical protein
MRLTRFTAMKGMLLLAGCTLTTGAMKSAGAAEVTEGQVSQAQGANLLQNADFVDGPKGWWLNPPGAAQISVVAPDVAGFKSAIRLELKPQPEKLAWNIIAGQRITSALKLNDAFELSLWGRSEQPTRVQVFVEQVAAPHTKSFGRVLELDTQWKEFRVKGVCLQPFNASESQLSLYLGEASGVVELTGLRLVHDTSALPAVPKMDRLL